MPGGRPKRYAKFEELVEASIKRKTKRPLYHDNIGVYPGARGHTAWVKINLRNGTTYRGKSYPSGHALEMKLGKLSSWDWKQLERKRDELQGKADRAEPLEDTKPPIFRDWANEWLERAKPRLRSYPIVRAHIKQHLLPEFGNRALDSITVGDVNSWTSKKLKDQKPATVKRERDTLQVILNEAVREGLISSNPCQHAVKISGIVGRRRYLNGEELTSLLTSAELVADWLPDIIRWAVHSGMRKSEILSLRWEDIAQFEDGRAFATVTHSKTDEPRLVTCTREMKEVLERQKRRQSTSGGSIFPVARMTLRRKWEKARKGAGLEDVTMHDLRRTHSTHAAVAGVDLRTLAYRMGHSDLTMLQKHYASIVGSASVEAAEKVQSAFDKISDTDGHD